MKPEKRVEKFLRRIDVIPDAERKRLRLEELLEVRDKTQEPTSADARPTIRRFIMNRQIWKVAAALVFATAVIGVIGILQNGGQAAYGWEQTVAAMQGKCSFHIQTYYGSPTRRKDEYWAEFDEQGQVIRCRQVEWLGQRVPEVEVIWENQIKYQYELDDKRGEPGILVISRTEHHVDEEDLEEFDPEMVIEGFNEEIENGEVAVVVDDSQTPDGHIVVEVTRNESLWRRMLVDPETKLVVRMDTYRLDEQDDEGNNKYLFGIEVLEYNQPFDPTLFQPNFPADTIVVDQLSREVGMAQGELSDEEVASQLMHLALEAWAADDYDTAGLLFGGTPKKFFTHRASDRPVGDIVVGEPESQRIQQGRPRFRIICQYVAERGGQRTTIDMTYCVTTVAGQPGRWFVTPIKL